MADEKTPQHPDIQLKLIHMNDVQETKTHWLWYPYIPYGKITIIQGDPGEGKTTLVLHLAAALTRGEMLGSEEQREPVTVIYQTAEDGLTDTIKRRLIATNEREAKAVIMIYSMYLSGYGYQQIADALNADGYKTKAGNAFNRNSFAEILRNEKYTGVYIFNRAESKGYDHKRNNHRSKPAEEIIRIEGGIPAIISKETWLAAQEYRMKHASRNLNAKTMYLLSGVIKCGCCNKIMYGCIRIRRNKPSFYTYTCKTQKSECTNLKEIDRDSLECYVVELVIQKSLRQNSTELDKLMTLEKDSPDFRKRLQQYIREVIVYKDYVMIFLYVDGKVKSYRHKRVDFKTISQRYFKT